jgi:phosphomevalonate kinase
LVTPLNRSALLIGRSLKEIVPFFIQSALIIAVVLPMGFKLYPLGVLVGMVLLGAFAVGLGALSYALAIALSAALDTLLEKRADVHTVAARAHRAFQSGKGSGVDIAASFAGGTQRFETAGQYRLRELRWPAGLDYRVLWSGCPSSTAQKLRRLPMNHKDDDASIAIQTSAKRVADVWESGSVDDVLGALSKFVAHLQQYSGVHNIGVFEAGHQELLDPAVSRGLVYKPCGAGGGDVGIAFGTDAKELNAFCDFAGGKGFTPVNIALAARGVALSHGKKS